MDEAEWVLMHSADTCGVQGAFCGMEYSCNWKHKLRLLSRPLRFWCCSIKGIRGRTERGFQAFWLFQSNRLMSHTSPHRLCPRGKEDIGLQWPGSGNKYKIKIFCQSPKMQQDGLWMTSWKRTIYIKLKPTACELIFKYSTDNPHSLHFSSRPVLPRHKSWSRRFERSAAHP